MSLFTDRVDLFFVGKLVLGVGFIKALLHLLAAVPVPLGSHVPSRFLLARSPGLAAVEAAGLAIVCWVGFTLVERARVRNAKGGNMAWRSLFVYRTRPARGLVKAAPGEPPAGGAFITPQTLTSFTGASAIIGIATRVVVALVPSANGRLVATVAALLIGLIVFLINVTDPQARPSDRRSWFIASVVGVVNILYLVAVALGVFEVLAGTHG